MDLPLTEKGNRHVLVIQYFLTKWPWVFPIPDQKTIRLVDTLVREIIPVCGVNCIPECLLSDRGTNLLSHLMRVVEVTPTGITAQREYTAKDDITRVHLNCVTRCPLSFPVGYYWYGDRRHGPGRPPKVVADSTGDQIEAEELDVTPEERDITPEDSELDNIDDPEVPEDLPEWTDEQEEVLPPPGIRTRTRAIQPPTYYGRSKAQASFQ